MNNKSKSIYANALPVIVPKIESFDIDTEDDLTIIRLVANKYLI